MLQASHAAFGLGGAAFGDLSNYFGVLTMLACGLAIAITAFIDTERRAFWLLVSLCELTYTAGQAYFFFVQGSSGSFPATSDFLRLSLYPLAGLAVLLFLRNGGRTPHTAILLDGAAIGLILGALGYALVVNDLLRIGLEPPSILDGRILYPAADLAVIAMAAVIGYCGRWGLGSAYVAAMGALVLLLVTDTYNAHAVVSASSAPKSILGSGWPAAFLLMALAAPLQLRLPPLQALRGRSLSVTLGVSMLAALALVLTEALTDGTLEVLVPASLALVLLGARLIFTLTENQRLIHDREAILAAAGEGIFRIDVDHRFTEVNPAAANLLGYEAEELLGRPVHQVIHRSDTNGEPYAESECPMQHSITSGETERVNDDMFWRRGGPSFPVDYTSAPIREDGEIVGAVVVFDDVSQQRDMQTRLRHATEHDPLTGLLNRRSFGEALSEQLVRSRRHRQPGAVLLIDLDSFTFVNESLGHSVGDSALCAAASAVEGRLRSADALGRLGGDEFAVLLRGVDEMDALQVADAILEAIRAATRPQLGASIGVALFEGGRDLAADDLLVGADIALHKAKEAGGRCVVRWEGEKGERLTWVEKIREALQADRLVIYSQPIVDLRTGEIEREEVLVRMLDRNGDVILPSSFLPTAERFGLMPEIDRQIVVKAIDSACRGRPLAVNISGRSLTDPQFMLPVSEAIRDGLDPHWLSFEITETAAALDIAAARRVAERLTNLGCALALDDFGTGLSSLSYLKHLPAQTLKIDIEFIRHLRVSWFDQNLVQLIVSIAQRLGQKTVAEGVEDAATLSLLRTLEVDYAQGYYIGRPEPLQVGGAPEITPPVLNTLEAAQQPSC